MARTEVNLTLPLPPSKNTWPSHHMAAHRAKRAYQTQAWVAAVQQAIPQNNPPEHVTVYVHCFVTQERDEDNLVGSLKWLIDALKSKQRGSVGWRRGLYDARGYLIDDDPSHMTLEAVSQSVDHKNPRSQLSIVSS